MNPVKVGVIGCGNISSIYFKNCKTFDILEVAGCADLVPERAQAKAAEFKLPRAYTVDEMLADPSIEIIINLTIPKAHAEIGLAALKAGKSVYNEKPLTIAADDAQAMLRLAQEKNLRIGCAPDTFLGGGLQTCRKLIDDGVIGRPVAATAFMVCHGHESWHPAPEFYYEVGGGPMFDMGPYYLTALVSLLGSVKRVTGSTRISFPERTITSQPQAGKKITVEVPTHVVGVLDFAAGAVATLVTSFDVWSANVPNIEIYGSEGSLSLPDPNTFGGPVRVKRYDEKDWRDVTPAHGYTENSRGLGVADMAHGLRQGAAHRANGEMAYHVLDIMHAIHQASDQGQHMHLASSCARPEALPVGKTEAALWPGQ